MRAVLIRTIVLLAAAALSGCRIAQKAIGLPGAPDTIEGQLTPPPAGDSATAGWSLGFGEHAVYKNLDVSQAHDAAKALQGKLVSVSADTPQPPIMSWTAHSIQIDKLKGVIRHVPIDGRHPTEWMFATRLSNVAFDAFLDASHIPDAEQWIGKNVQITAHFEGQARTGLRLVADTIELQ